MSDGYAVWNASINESLQMLLNQTGGGAEHSVLRNVIVGIILSCIVLASFFGNLLVVCAVCSNRRLRTVTNYFVVSLAMADLLVSVLVMPFHIVVELSQRWWFGFVICDIWISLDVMFCTASILNLCCISVDRYFAITRPLVYATRRSKKLALIMITVVWIVSIAVTCPPIFGWQEDGRWDDESACALTKDPGYIIYSSLGSFYVPMLIMLFVYAKIFQVTREREIRLKPYRRSVMMASRANETNLEEMSLSETKCSSGENEFSGNSSGEKEEKSANQIPSNDSISNVHSPPMRRHQGYTVEFTLSRNSNNSRQCSFTYTSKNNYQSCGKGGRHGSLRLNNVPKVDKAKLDSKKMRAIVAKERKAAKTLAIVVGAFIVCWLPFFMVYVIEPFCQTCYIPILVVTMVTWLGYVNSTVNPFIYAFSNRDFRRAYWKLTCGKFAKWRDRIHNRHQKRPVIVTRR